MSAEGEDFLSRWSRRKQEARRVASEVPPAPSAGAQPGADPAAPIPPEREPVAPVAPVQPALPPVEELRGLDSEYQEFLGPGVDETVRRSALKKLFHDPHFNRMDGLDTYIEDYTQPDPIPEAMLKALNQAKGLVYDREDDRVPMTNAPAGPSAQLEPPPVGAGGDGDAGATQKPECEPAKPPPDRDRPDEGTGG